MEVVGPSSNPGVVRIHSMAATPLLAGLAGGAWDRNIALFYRAVSLVPQLEERANLFNQLGYGFRLKTVPTLAHLRSDVDPTVALEIRKMVLHRSARDAELGTDYLLDRSRGVFAQREDFHNSSSNRLTQDFKRMHQCSLSARGRAASRATKIVE